MANTAVNTTAKASVVDFLLGAHCCCSATRCSSLSRLTGMQGVVLAVLFFSQLLKL
jgi:hypothetical protein